MLVEILKPIKIRKGTLQPGVKIDIPELIATQLIFDKKIKPISQSCAHVNRESISHSTTGGDASTFIPVEPLTQWQDDFCLSHGMFNNWRGGCPSSIDDCLISKVIDSGGNIDNLRKLEIGQGITTDMVIDAWLDTGEPAEDLFKNPTWLICVAEHQKRGR